MGGQDRTGLDSNSYCAAQSQNQRFRFGPGQGRRSAAQGGRNWMEDGLYGLGMTPAMEAKMLGLEGEEAERVAGEIREWRKQVGQLHRDMLRQVAIDLDRRIMGMSRGSTNP